MNVYDSSRIADMLKKEGFEETSKQAEADIVLFNTCHIREKAAEKLFSDLGRAHLIELERLEQTGKKTIIGVVGCVVQAEDNQIIKRAPSIFCLKIRRRVLVRIWQFKKAVIIFVPIVLYHIRVVQNILVRWLM